MEGRFAGRVVIVTGGASGIGAATARAFAAEGARVVIADVDRERGREVAGATAGVFEAVDVGDGAAVRALVERAVAAFRRVDVLVSNAFATSVGSIERFALEAWTRTLEVTLTAAFTGLQAVAPVMRAQGGGAVVNVASISGLGGDRGLAAYNAAKAGMINLTRTAALELASAGIRVNAVCPGLIATPALARARGRPRRPLRAARGGGARDPLPRLRRGVLHHGNDAGGGRRLDGGHRDPRSHARELTRWRRTWCATSGRRWPAAGGAGSRCSSRSPGRCRSAWWRRPRSAPASACSTSA